MAPDVAKETLAGVSSRAIEQHSWRLDHSNNARRLRLQYLAQQLYALGPGPLCHFLAEVEAGEDLRPHLERYARLPREFVLAYGGDRLPERVLVIKGGRAQ